ncbi:RMD1 family protein [Chroococcidiopsis sp.]|uniref:RMD1 family protein n=1 Tax=Chroococcidiopsis sp. TaxID=3088168 RepID=UPI003F365C1A
MQTILFGDRDIVPVRALLLGQSLDLKTLEQIDFLAKDPLVVAAGESGCAALFHYGAVVLYGLSPLEEAIFINNLRDFTIVPFASPEVENVEIHRDANSTGTVEGDIIFLPDFDLKSLQILATILAKSVILAYYEIQIASAFERIEPFANRLQHSCWGKQQVGELLKQLGNALAVEHKMVGRVQVIDKPKLLWEYSELDRFYLRLEKEFEIQQRQLVLERKLALVYRTIETSLSLLQHNTNLRVEWYIVILIVVEIFLSLYEMIFNR